MTLLWDWGTGQERVRIEEVESSTSEVMRLVCEWAAEREKEAEDLCLMHNRALMANDAYMLSLCDLIASGGIAGAP